MELHEQLEQVHDADSFLVFARALMSDRLDSVAKEAVAASSTYEPESNGWENTRIDSFLEAAIAWAEDSRFGATQGTPLSNPWQ